MKFYPIPGCIHPMSCCGSHLVGAVAFSVFTFYLLSRKHCNFDCKIAVAVFGFTCVFLLAVSTVYHFLPLGGDGHKMMQRLDHAAIFGLIAGSFTPVQWIFFTGLWRWGILLLVWVVAAMGITLNMMFFESIPEELGTILYLGLGWIGLVPAIALWRRYGFLFIKPFVYGGLSYTVGALAGSFGVPLIIPGVAGPHEFLHFAVLVGLSYHWQFVFRSIEHVAGESIAMSA